MARRWWTLAAVRGGVFVRQRDLFQRAAAGVAAQRTAPED
jgi:hypothetical protein